MKQASTLYHLIFSVITLLAGIVLGGCGQRGPLMLPVRPPAISTVPTPPATSATLPAAATEPTPK